MLQTQTLRIGVINIGDELLRGFTVNSNLSDIGSQLLSAGFLIERCAVVKDSENSIKNELSNMLASGMHIVIITGGLGPTIDDLTKKTVADFLRIGFLLSQEVIEHLKLYWSGRKGPIPEKVLEQAMIPTGSSVFPNKAGTAPGLKIPVNPESSELPVVILLPGPPREMNPMFKNYVLPFIQSINGFCRNFTETIYVTGFPESEVEKLALPTLKDERGVSLAFCASPEAVKVYISGNDQNEVQRIVFELRKIFDNNVLPEGISSSVEELAVYCLKHGISLATAESCTGGMIAAALTDISGISAVYKGSIVSYSNEWKNNILGVSQQTLERYGAVSEECAYEMVVNLCNKYNTDAGVSVTGIAGPGGGTDEKPVGLVFIGVKYKGKTDVKKMLFPGDRERIRIRTVHSACSLLKSLINS